MLDLSNIDDVTLVIDDKDKDENELDLVRLVSTNANDANHYLLFVGSDEQYYSMNVSKIEELLSYKDLDVVRNHDKGSTILGTANIRGQMTSIVSFDKWMGNEVLDDKSYELVVIASYGNKRFAIVVKEVESIVSIDSDNMSDNSIDNSKSSFISEVNINGVNRLCTIFDSDMLLLDVFDDIEKKAQIDTSLYNVTKNSDKLILFADDSKYIRKIVEDLFIKLDLNYKIYKDGKELVDDLPNINTQDIGLFITDLEMPELNGKDVIQFIRNNNQYEDINIIVHTNMSNDIMSQDLIKSDVAKIITKVDMQLLAQAIEELILP